MADSSLPAMNKQPQSMWLVATPWRSASGEDWIPDFIAKDKIRHIYVNSDYQHDRSRRQSSLGQWKDYLLHSAKCIRQAGINSRSVGIITVFPQLAFTSSLLKKVTRSKSPIVAWCFNLNRPYKGIKGLICRLILNEVSLFIVHSRAEVAMYSTWLRLPQCRFKFVPLTVADVTLPIETLMYKSATVVEKPFVLAMGTANRDYKTFLAAVEELNYPAVIIAGRHAVKTSTLPRNVKLLNGLTIEDCHDYVRRARVNVVSIADTNSPSGQVTLIEAMMLGKAVVATRCVGTEDYICHEKDGLFCEPNCVESMKEAIKRVWESDQLRTSIGCSARRTASSRYTFDAVSSSMLCCLEQTIEN